MEEKVRTIQNEYQWPPKLNRKTQKRLSQETLSCQIRKRLTLRILPKPNQKIISSAPTLTLSSLKQNQKRHWKLIQSAPHQRKINIQQSYHLKNGIIRRNAKKILKTHQRLKIIKKLITIRIPQTLKRIQLTQKTQKSK